MILRHTHTQKKKKKKVRKQQNISKRERNQE